MSDDFYPISDPVEGSVPTPAGDAPLGRARRRRRVGLAAAALALVAGGTVGGITLGNVLGSGEHGPGFGTVTSQAFTGGQDEPSQPDQPARPATTSHGGDGNDAD